MAHPSSFQLLINQKEVKLKTMDHSSTTFEFPHLKLHQRKMADLWIRSIPLTLQNHFQIMNSEYSVFIWSRLSMCRLTRDIMTIWIFVSCRVISNQLYNSDHIVYWHFGYSCNNQRNTASCKHCRESVPPTQALHRGHSQHMKVCVKHMSCGSVHIQMHPVCHHHHHRLHQSLHVYDKKKKVHGEFTVLSFLHREVFTHSHKKQKRVTKNNQCINWRSKASRWRWRGRSWRGILSVTICRWRSHPSGLGFWFWAAMIVSAGGFSLDVRSCPGWGAPGLAACSAFCTGPPSCPTPWRRRRSCGSRSPWSWSHSLPPRCGSPRLSAKCSPGSRPRYNRQERR